METNPPPTPPKKTAHQLWSDRITYQLREILFPKDRREGKAFFTLAKSELERMTTLACQYAHHHETTKTRILTDEMILLLDESRTAVIALEERYKATHWLRFRKRRELAEMHRASKMVRDAYQKAVLVLVNTKPPSMVVHREEGGQTL